MDGLLLVDKPAGPTSHDVVARLRRALHEKRIGHTGTLDPAATGLLPLVIGRATRLAQFLDASDKAYDATIRLGFSTDSGDAQGQAIGAAFSGPWPSRDAIDAALNEFRGTFMQQPPAFSAKKIDGQRSYKLARNARRALPGPPAPPALPAPVSVTTHRIEIVSLDTDRATLSVVCSAGFYVRSLAHDLGQRLGTGAHLTALRRTRCGAFALAGAVTLDAVEREPMLAETALVSMAAMLPDLPALTLTGDAVRRARHGQDLPADGLSGTIRLLDEAGELVGIGLPSAIPGLLHPSVVLV
jgi:tRNA pseudouridine55 synthase